MTDLLEFREKLKLFYSKNEVFILPVIKFLLAFVVLLTLNGQMGYMTRLDNVAIVLIVALMCSFLPNGAIVIFASLFALLHMYALAIEVALVGFCIFLLVFLLYGRFSAKESLVIVLTPIACCWGIPYVMPVAMGLLGTPTSAISVACGVVVYHMLAAVTDNASTINTMGDDEATAKIRLVIDGLLDNKAMLVMLSAFVITVFVVYLIRRMSIDHSWTIAVIAGVITDLVILLVGDLLYDTSISAAGAILGVVLTFAVAKMIEFFRFCVDYSRTEKVQFEDDEYYYYVKAVPKMTVSTPTKTVKRINSQSAYRTITPTRRNEPASTGRSTAGGSKSVTINGNMTKRVEDDSIEYEDIF